MYTNKRVTEPCRGGMSLHTLVDEDAWAEWSIKKRTYLVAWCTGTCNATFFLHYFMGPKIPSKTRRF